MRQLWPEPGDVDPAEAYLAAPRPTPEGRPFVVASMVATLDGATATGGVSGDLGGTADRTVFRAVRGLGDVIMAGGGTVRAEGYGRIRLADDVVAARRGAGLDDRPPRLAVVSGALDLDPDDEIFAGDTPALVITADGADRARRALLEARTDVIVAGSGRRVEAVPALRALAAFGMKVVVLEGGPTLNGAFHAADVIDELCMTIDPTIAGGDSHRIVHHGPARGREHVFALASLLVSDDVLCGRWVRDRDA